MARIYLFLLLLADIAGYHEIFLSPLVDSDWDAVAIAIGRKSGPKHAVYNAGAVNLLHQ